MKSSFSRVGLARSGRAEFRKAGDSRKAAPGERRRWRRMVTNLL